MAIERVLIVTSSGRKRLAWMTSNKEVFETRAQANAAQDLNNFIDSVTKDDPDWVANAEAARS